MTQHPQKRLAYHLPLDPANGRWADVYVPADFTESEVERVCRILRCIGVPESWRDSIDPTSLLTDEDWSALSKLLMHDGP
jgi:hypothetical protein